MMFWKTGCNCLPGCMGKAARKHREGFVMTETKYIFPKQPQSVTVFYNRADRSASYPDCNGTYEEQKTEKYAGRTDGGKTAFG